MDFMVRRNLRFATIQKTIVTYSFEYRGILPFVGGRFCPKFLGNARPDQRKFQMPSYQFPHRPTVIWNVPVVLSGNRVSRA